MKTDMIGGLMADARKKCGLTQEQLAEKVGVSVQAVSKWETGRNLPDIDNLLRVAEITNTPYQFLLMEEEALPEKLEIRTRLFKEENMYTRMRGIALAENLTETFKALPYMRERHLGQMRKKSKFSNQMVQYINHPLTLACHAHALGIREDDLLAAILLHDVVEDTGVTVEELPFSDAVRELVGLVSFFKIEGKTKEESKELYYEAIGKNGKACVIKVIDRCNNVSTMAACYSREKMFEYIEETEKYVLPLTTILKNNYPEYNDIAFITKYHILSVIETVKNLIVR